MGGFSVALRGVWSVWGSLQRPSGFIIRAVQVFVKRTKKSHRGIQAAPTSAAPWELAYSAPPS